MDVGARAQSDGSLPTGKPSVKSKLESFLERLPETTSSDDIENAQSATVRRALEDPNWLSVVESCLCQGRSTEELGLTLRVLQRVAAHLECNSAMKFSDDIKQRFLDLFSHSLSGFLSKMAKHRELLTTHGVYLLQATITILLKQYPPTVKLLNNVLAIVKSWLAENDGETSQCAYDALVFLITKLDSYLSEMKSPRRLRVIRTLSRSFLFPSKTNQLKVGDLYLKTWTVLLKWSLKSDEELDAAKELLMVSLLFCLGSKQVCLRIENSKAKSLTKSETSLFVNEKLFERCKLEDFVDHHFSGYEIVSFIKTILNLSGVETVIGQNWPFLSSVIDRASALGAGETLFHDANGVRLIVQSFHKLLELGVQEKDDVKSHLLHQFANWLRSTPFNIVTVQEEALSIFNSFNTLLPYETTTHWSALIIMQSIVENSQGKMENLKPSLFCRVSETLSPDSPVFLPRIHDWVTFVNDHWEKLPTHGLLEAWTILAGKLKVHVETEDEINEGSILKPNFSSTFNFIGSLFKLAKRSNFPKDFAPVMVVLGELFDQVQTSIAQESCCKQSDALLEVLAKMEDNTENVAQLSLHVATLAQLCAKFNFASVSDSVVIDETGEFDVLGDVRPLVSRLATTLKYAKELAVKTENDTKASRIPTIEGMSRAQDICRDISTHIDTIALTMEKVERANVVTAIFRFLAEPLNDVIKLSCSGSKFYKGLTSSLIENIIKILIRVKDNTCDPFDNTMLQFVDGLFATCLSHSNARLKNAAAAAWKATFNSNNSLQLSAALRAAILSSSKRHALVVPVKTEAPGATEDKVPEKAMGPPTTEPLTKLRTPLANKKKRVMALLDDDSVDYVPIQSTSSAKKMKLTDHQKEAFSETRDKLPYMDEDSVQYNPNLLTSIMPQFDVDTSMSVSCSLALKEPVGEKSVDEPKAMEVDAVSVTAPQESQAVAPSPAQKPVKKRSRSSVKLNFDDCELSNDGLGVHDSSSITLDDKLDEVSILPVDAVEKEPSSSQSSLLSFASSISEDVKISTDSCDSDNSHDSDVTIIKSRRSQSKSTPSKYVTAAAPRSATKKDGTPMRKRGRPKKQSLPAAVPITTSSPARRKSAVVIVTDLGNPTTATEKSKEVEVVESTSSEKVPSENNAPEEQAANVTPEKMSSDSEPMICTPSVRRVFEAGTPGILKKVGSPSTVERKRLRVHFNNEEMAGAGCTSETNEPPFTPKSKGLTPRKLLEEVSQEKEQTGNYSPAASIASVAPVTPVSNDLELPNASVYPELAENKEPIMKIISKLLPIAQTGAMFLRRNLEQKGIVTVGDLARLPRKEAAVLPVKKPRLETIRNALEMFALPKATTTSPLKLIEDVVTPIEKESTEMTDCVMESPVVDSVNSGSDIATVTPELTADVVPEQTAAGQEKTDDVQSTEVVADSFQETKEVDPEKENVAIDESNLVTENPADASESVTQKDVNAENSVETVEESALTTEKVSAEEIAQKDVNSELENMSVVFANLAENLPATLSSDELKQLLSNSSKIFDSLSVLQKELIKRMS